MATSERAQPLLTWLKGVTKGALIHLRVDAVPAPATRQVSRTGHIFWSKASAEYLAECQQQIVAQLPVPADAPIACDVAVVLESVLPRPKTTKLLRPKPDVDNLAKHPLDALKKLGVWLDDTQIIALATIKRWASPGEQPHANLWIGAAA